MSERKNKMPFLRSSRVLTSPSDLHNAKKQGVRSFRKLDFPDGDGPKLTQTRRNQSVLFRFLNGLKATRGLRLEDLGLWTQAQAGRIRKITKRLHRLEELSFLFVPILSHVYDDWFRNTPNLQKMHCHGVHMLQVEFEGGRTFQELPDFQEPLLLIRYQRHLKTLYLKQQENLWKDPHKPCNLYRLPPKLTRLSLLNMAGYAFGTDLSEYYSVFRKKKPRLLPPLAQLKNLESLSLGIHENSHPMVLSDLLREVGPILPQLKHFSFEGTTPRSLRTIDLPLCFERLTTLNLAFVMDGTNWIQNPFRGVDQKKLRSFRLKLRIGRDGRSSAKCWKMARQLLKDFASIHSLHLVAKCEVAETAPERLRLFSELGLLLDLRELRLRVDYPQTPSTLDLAPSQFLTTFFDRQAPLESFEISQNQPISEAEFRNLLTRLVPHASFLTELKLSFLDSFELSAMILSDLSPFLGKSSKLKDLKLDGIIIKDQGLTEVSKTITCMAELEVLRIGPLDLTETSTFIRSFERICSKFGLKEYHYTQTEESLAMLQQYDFQVDWKTIICKNPYFQRKNPLQKSEYVLFWYV